MFVKIFCCVFLGSTLLVKMFVFSSTSMMRNKFFLFSFRVFCYLAFLFLIECFIFSFRCPVTSFLRLYRYYIDSLTTIENLQTLAMERLKIVCMDIFSTSPIVQERGTVNQIWRMSTYIPGTKTITNFKVHKWCQPFK